MADGYTGADVYARMHRFNGDTSTLDSGQHAAQSLKSGHEDLVTRIATLQGKLDGTWQGDASQKAQAGFTPLIQTSQQAADDLNRSAESITAQNSGFHETLTKLAPMDTNRPDTDDLASYNPFGASDSEKKAAQWDTNDQNNKSAYGSYYATTDGNRNNAAKDYPALNSAPAGLAVAPAPPPGGHAAGTASTGHGGVPSGHSAMSGHSGSGHSGGGTVQVSPYSGGAGHSLPASGTGGTHEAGATAPPPGEPPTDSTSTAGYTPKPPASDAPGFGSGRLPTFGPGGGGGDSSTGSIGGFGLPGGAGSGLSGGTAGGIGSGTGGGAGSRPGGGAGSQLGTGAGTGSGGPAGQGVARPGSGTTGVPGAKGSSGMGGMGSGAGKGKGGEDEDHERKVTLPDQDADELFGGYPDGMRPTPPTIGA